VDTSAAARSIPAFSYSAKQRRKREAGLSLATRSYWPSVAVQSSRVAEVYLATVTIPSGREGRGWDARVMISLRSFCWLFCCGRHKVRTW